jgi:hypothetical protein
MVRVSRKVMMDKGRKLPLGFNSRTEWEMVIMPEAHRTPINPKKLAADTLRAHCVGGLAY